MILKAALDSVILIHNMLNYSDSGLISNKLGECSCGNQMCFVTLIDRYAVNYLYQLRKWCFFLAHLVMSLCNHALSVVWCCCRHLRCRQHLCTALPVIALIIETSYLANICSYTPNICTWNIRSMWSIFFKQQPL